MRSPSEVDDIDWGAFPGPSYFRPAEIPKAIRRLAALTEFALMEEVESACLFAFGNNHSGNLFAVAPPVVPFLVWFIVHGSPAARAATHSVLVQAACFDGLDGVTVQNRAGVHVSIDRAFREALRAEVDEIVASDLALEAKAIAADLRETLDGADERCCVG